MKSIRHWRWHLDEVYVKINGEMYYLWRAVDHEGEVLENHEGKCLDEKPHETWLDVVSNSLLCGNARREGW